MKNPKTFPQSEHFVAALISAALATLGGSVGVEVVAVEVVEATEEEVEGAGTEDVETVSMMIGCATDVAGGGGVATSFVVVVEVFDSGTSGTFVSFVSSIFLKIQPVGGSEMVRLGQLEIQPEGLDD